ncbi:hypothetical protein CO054_01845 [Candidatus Shapirobacteria bacterium CG_4_9_14_0_2_um_filter_39_11]|uniref:Uncharacterized protein n=1 Tax=Candidatus Shapirobacteria bacterium CG_4_9_14_0_2_um_filter_39_11 TaxID=1974478 RepID=A0A2M8ESN6_9BACT|nr:MAG: hypothetical protein CO054_01845 [Candidatus Shapirobacteria bacterium CG_4_9_14_0_2_um_filter_39_11]
MRPEFFRYSLRNAFKKIEREKGISSENLTAIALKNLFESVDWINDFRRANWFEDRKKGIDFIIETDVGKIFLQVKSSKTGKENSLKKHPKIPVIIINKNFELEETKKVIMDTLSEQRKLYLEKRLSTQEVS